ncbi:DNA-binding response regulator, NarL/FixJ family, contains REC and HTH domains [Lentzea waywayandensis]|uniref:DNA-binding response regulator, NarL/FixJ family, contains REC and HTH domains n=1 Tax=Lentzea waywayandensis TaxID=84724 RepID=A0A1I6FGS6_9PSEU|nr:response regulator transcription factor [Lentzea waywayandensis]SFR29141.1 DNA-binding response regulator, NarL/FixJ family, contains REC and HTH domains [Lentzea waywayandensis]
MIEIGVIDDEGFYRDVMGRWLDDGDEKIELVAATATVAEYLALPRRAPIVILDLNLADGSMFTTNIRSLIAAGHQVVVFSAWAEHSDVEAATKAGAETYLHKRTTDTATLASVVREVAAGESPMTVDHAFALSRNKNCPELSLRQRQVLETYGSGVTLKATARRLGMSESTVKEHIRRIKAKYAEIGRPIGYRGDFGRRLAEDNGPAVTPAE